MGELLFLSHRPPFPPNRGDKLRSWHFLEHLAQQHKIYLGCFYDDPEEEKNLAILRETCAEVYGERIPPTPLNLRNMQAFIKNEPISITHYRRSGMRRWVANKLYEAHLSAVFAFSGAMAQYLPQTSNTPRRILDLVDLDSRKWLDYAERSSLFGRWIYNREAKLLANFEIVASQNVDLVTLVSNHEAESLRKLTPDLAGKILTVPNGVALPNLLETQSLTRPSAVGTKTIVFVGVMDYRPNVDAVLWFCDEILPLLRESDSETNFVIVGTDPAPEVERLSRRTGVTVTGAVESVSPYIQHAAAIAIPLRMPQGVPNKILEAMAMAKAIVTTPVALKGLEHVTPGRDLFASARASEFAHYLLQVLGDGAQASALGEAARECVRRHYSWEPSLTQLDQILFADLDSLQTGAEKSGAELCVQA